MNANISVFFICVEVSICLLLYNLHDNTLNRYFLIILSTFGEEPAYLTIVRTCLTKLCFCENYKTVF